MKTDFQTKTALRATVQWSFFASGLLIANCWLAGQHDPVSRRIVSHLALSWRASGGPVYWVEGADNNKSYASSVTDSDRPLSSSQNPTSLGTDPELVSLGTDPELGSFTLGDYSWRDKGWGQTPAVRAIKGSQIGGTVAEFDSTSGSDVSTALKSEDFIVAGRSSTGASLGDSRGSQVTVPAVGQTMPLMAEANSKGSVFKGIPDQGLAENESLFQIPAGNTSELERQDSGSEAMARPDRLAAKPRDSFYDGSPNQIVSVDDNSMPDSVALEVNEHAVDQPTNSQLLEEPILSIDSSWLDLDDPSGKIPSGKANEQKLSTETLIDQDRIAKKLNNSMELSIGTANDTRATSQTIELTPPNVAVENREVMDEITPEASLSNRKSTAIESINPISDSVPLESLKRKVPTTSVPVVVDQSRDDANDEKYVAEEDSEPVTDSKAKDHQRALAEASSSTWPLCRQLLIKLDDLDQISTKFASKSVRIISNRTASTNLASGYAASSQWSSSVRSVLKQLPELSRLGDPNTSGLLGELDRLTAVANQQVSQVDDDELRVSWIQAVYALQRRLAVWKPVYTINSGDHPVLQHVTDQAVTVSDAIQAVEGDLPATGDAAGWKRYLVIDQLRSALSGGNEADRREAARVFLARVQWTGLHGEHRRWMESSNVVQLTKAIEPWASSPVDYPSLLHQIEKIESNSIDLVTSDIAQSVQSLRYARHPEAVQLASNLDTYYRNANVRMTIGSAMLHHVLPDIPTRRVPVRTTLLGSRVTGYSQIASQLGIRIGGAPDHWRMVLETSGNVSTSSVGRNGPAAFKTSSISDFVASTPIIVRPDNLDVANTTINVRGGSNLRGVNTKYDSWPLFGALVRNIAENEYWKKAPLSNRIANSRVQQQLRSEIDRSVNDKIREVSTHFSETILGPLNDLKLDPVVTDMQSSADELVARYRMAGQWQLAAMTPRPRAPGDSLFSVQVHHSAINNTLEQLVVQETPLPIQSVLSQCLAVLGIDPESMPADLPEDAVIQFAKHRPITVEIEDGKVWITMRIIRLERERLKLRNFIVRAGYVPVVDGLEAKLRREKHLSISGHRLSIRDRLPVRAIFNKVLSPNRDLTIISSETMSERVPEGTVLTQFALRDGWLGVAFGTNERDGEVIATRPGRSAGF